MNDKNIEKAFEKIIKDKSVIFVGPSPILLNKNMGDFIDSFDVVVRSNNSFPIPKEHQKDYGTKCDVIYLNHQFIKRKKDSKKEYLKEIDFICSKSKVITNENRIYDVFKHSHSNKYILGGTFICYDLLKKKPKKLHITGIDFYHTSIHLKNFTYMKEKTYRSLSNCHNIEEDIDFFKKEILSNKNVYIDDFLKNLIF